MKKWKRWLCRLRRGVLLHLLIEDISREEGKVRCAVQKDGGDDPDVTTGIYVYANVSYSDTPQITLDGGIGVGRVTKPGLWQAVGEAAINKVPRQMILGKCRAGLQRISLYRWTERSDRDPCRSGTGKENL